MQGCRLRNAMPPTGGYSVIVGSQEVSLRPITPVPAESIPRIFAGDTVILSGILESSPGNTEAT